MLGDYRKDVGGDFVVSAPLPPHEAGAVDRPGGAELRDRLTGLVAELERARAGKSEQLPGGRRAVWVAEYALTAPRVEGPAACSGVVANGHGRSPIPATT
jgi:hypothetical protein